MKPVHSLIVAALAATAAPTTFAQSDAYQPVQTEDGRIVVHFLDGALQQAGLELLAIQETAPTGTSFQETMDGDLMGFALSAEDHITVLQDRDGEFIPYGVIGGSASVLGGFMLSSPSTGRTVDFTGFTVAPSEVRNDGPGGAQDPDYFFLSANDGIDGGETLVARP